MLQQRYAAVAASLQARWPALARFARPLRFGVVGASGVAVNTAVLWLVWHFTHIALPIASALATETAVVSNFLLNDRWTFRSASHGSVLWRFLRFNGVALGGLLITALILTLLVAEVGLPLLVANLIAVGCALIWNYQLNNRWTWRTTLQNDKNFTDESLVATRDDKTVIS